jgi:hypothetical protein
MSKKNKKSSYKIIAEAVAFDGLKKVKMPTGRVDRRRLSVDEIKQCIEEEFGKAKDVDDEEVLDFPKGWGDEEIKNHMNHIDWLKKLDLKEFFVKKGKK